ncbi:MAG TPA: hypothetical protein VK548_05400 [Candidatus Acidoferrum sp.]|nr:hypothetical protein [Candidatus Acidoferrum sp.]
MKRTASVAKGSRSSVSSRKRGEPTTGRTQYVVCIKNDGNPESLELRKIYRALPDAEAAKHGYTRVIDETGEDYLYSRHYFLAVALPRKLPSTARRAFA